MNSASESRSNHPSVTAPRSFSGVHGRLMSGAGAVVGVRIVRAALDPIRGGVTARTLGRALGVRSVVGCTGTVRSGAATGAGGGGGSSGKPASRRNAACDSAFRAARLARLPSSRVGGAGLRSSPWIVGPRSARGRRAGAGVVVGVATGGYAVSRVGSDLSSVSTPHARSRQARHSAHALDGKPWVHLLTADARPPYD